jgi:hypothetical protein
MQKCEIEEAASGSPFLLAIFEEAALICLFMI